MEHQARLTQGERAAAAVDHGLDRVVRVLSV